MLLVETGLYQLGNSLGIGFYGTILLIAIAFLAGSCVYFLRTGWYLFPLLYLNFDYLGYRFVYVQDNTYLVMLATLLAALFLARMRQPLCHAFVAAAVAIKLSPLFYIVNLRVMTMRWRVVFVVMLLGWLVLPYWLWEDYLYIYSYGNELKGDWLSSLGALAIAAPFAIAVWYVQERRGFDLEERIGWGVVPIALFLAWKMNVARHLLLVLLVPDKRGVRNVAAAAGLLLPAVLPDLVAFNSSLAVASAVLIAALACHLRAIGGAQIREDIGRLRRALRLG